MKERIIKAWPFLLTIVLAVAIWGVLTVRAAAPLVSSFLPVDGETFFASSSNLIINFNQNVFAGAGDVVIRRLADDSIFENIPAASSNIIIVGSQVTINPSRNLENDTFYYINVGGSAFRNGSSEYYSGISNRTDWNIHSRDELFFIEKVADLNLNTGDFLDNYNLVASGGVAYFPGNSELGRELWTSDGTVGGTHIVKDVCQKDICAGGIGYNGVYAVAPNLAYFLQDDGVYGDSVYSTDGTEVGTHRLTPVDYHSGDASTTCYDLSPAGQNAYFICATSSERILYKTDGTVSGTVKVKGGFSSVSYQTFGYNDGLVYFYVSGNGTWVSDGTSVGTYKLNNVSGVGSFYKSGSLIYFLGSDGVNGQEMWRSDGTASGTAMLKDINPGASGSNARNGIDLDGILYFSAQNSGFFGSGLYRTDGTASGTYLVKDINPATSTERIVSNIAKLNGYVYFFADDKVNGTELWRSDGTASGTAMVVDFIPGSVGLDVDDQGLDAVDGKLYFATNRDYKLYVSDGTASGTVVLKNDNIGSSWDDIPITFVEVAGKATFANFDYRHGHEIWTTDGTTDNTVMLHDFNTVTNESDPRNFFIFNNKLFFTVDSSDYGREFFYLSPGDSTPHLLKDIYPGFVGGSPRISYYKVASTSGSFYFAANDGVNGEELWKSDGTANGTVLVKDINTGANGSSIYEVTSFNGDIYFSARTTATGQELWKSNGTSAGTTLVKNIGISSFEQGPTYLTPIGNYLYFTYPMSSTGNEPYRSDGTSAGTILLKSIKDGGANSIYLYANRVFVGLNNKAYFFADDGVDSVALWESDGTSVGTIKVKGLNPSVISYPSVFPAVDGLLSFIGLESDGDSLLWQSDGTSLGTYSLLNFGSSTYPSYEEVVNDSIFFGIDNNTVYKTNGTLAGTINLGSFSYAYQSITGYLRRPVLYQDKYYIGLASLNSEEGRIWRSDGTATGTVQMNEDNPGSYLFLSQGPITGLSFDGYYYFPSPTPNGDTELYRAAYVLKPSSLSGTASSISMSSALLSGTVLDKGLSPSIVRGFVYSSATSTPTATNSSSMLSDTGVYATGTYSITASSLGCSTDYYYRSFVQNNAGYGYGDVATFTTATCTCPIISYAATYNSYPTCGPASCVGGFFLGNGACLPVRRQPNLVSGGGVISSPKIIPVISPVATTTKTTIATSTPIVVDNLEQPEKVSDQTLAEWKRIDAMNSYIETKLTQQATKKESVIEKIVRASMLGKVKGRVLLQVESKGEAWYVNPDDSRRYYLGRPLEMFNVMRYFGLGAKHSVITNNTYYPERLWGKILLDVEDSGKAYYINPVDKKKYYLGRPAEAFNIVRNLGLGISNADLEKIWVDKNPTSR